MWLGGTEPEIRSRSDRNQFRGQRTRTGIRGRSLRETVHSVTAGTVTFDLSIQDYAEVVCAV